MEEVIHFLTQHGALVLFAAVFAEQVGLPVISLPFLVGAGALAGTGEMTLGVAVGSATLAALLGDQLWFELGRWRGRRLLNWVSRLSLKLATVVRRTEEFFGHHGARSLTIAKFVPGLSTIAPTLAGSVGVSVPMFVWYNSLGTLLWVGSGIALGYVFSGELEQGVSMAAHFGPTGGLALLERVIG